MVRNWHTVDKDERNKILRRLGSIFRQELRLSDLSREVNKITVDNLKEDTQSGLNWAVGKDLQHAKGITKNDIMSGNNAVVWIDIEKTMSQVEKGWELDLKDPSGGIHSIGNRVDAAKEYFQAGNYMDPSFLGVSEYSGKIAFTDGRHRLVAAYQLGARTAPVIVPKDNISALRALGVVISSGIQEAEHKLMVEDLAKEYVAEYKYADIGIKSLGVPRNKMPQIKRGMQHEFLEYLHSEGIMYEYRSKPANLLKATQDEFDPDKVQKKTKKPTTGKGNRPLIVSMDNYIIDGHHRWTSIIQRNPKDHVKILQVYMPIKKLLELMHDFDGVSYEELKEDDLEEIRRTKDPLLPVDSIASNDSEGELIELPCGYFLEMPTDSPRFLIRSDDGSVVGLILAFKDGNTLHEKVIRMQPGHKRLGCVSDAYLELLNQGYEIISDSGHTHPAEKLWRSLFNKVDMFLVEQPFPNGQIKQIYSVESMKLAYRQNTVWDRLLMKKKRSFNEAGVGKIVKGVNTTVDVGPGETRKQAKKFGFKLNKKNEPPLLEYVDPEKTVSKNFVALYTKLKSDYSAHRDFPFIKDWPQINPLELTTPREPEFQAQRDFLIRSMSREMASIIEVITDRVDPTPNHNYSLWIVQRYIKGGITYWEDMYKATLYLKTFDIMKKKRIFKEKYSADINQYKTLNQLAQIHKEFGEVAVTKRGEEEELINNGEAVILLNTARVKVVVPKTSKASCYYGQNTEWCTTAKFGRNYFDEYNKKGPLYIILDKKNNRRFQLHFETQQYMDENDNPVGIDAEEANITTRSQLPISLFMAYPEIVDVLPISREEGDTWHAKTSKIDYWTDDDGQYHRDIGPAKIMNMGGARLDEWYQHGKIHRDNGPARITIQSIDNVQKSTTEEWYRNGNLDRLDGPAITTPNEKEWYKGGVKHRDGGPALIRKDGYNKWYTNGKVHRVDGPAVVDVYNGNTGDGLLWVINGERHREGGPAMINIRESGIIEMWLENDAMKQFGDDSGANYPREVPERPNVIRLVNLEETSWGQEQERSTDTKGYVMEWLSDNDPETGEIYNTWHSALVERAIGDNGKIYKWDNFDLKYMVAGPDWPPLSQDEIAGLFAKYNSPEMRKAEEEKWTSLENGYEDF